MGLANNEIKEIIADGRAVLGMELGSTRIKAVLIAPDHSPILSGGSYGRRRRRCTDRRRRKAVLTYNYYSGEGVTAFDEGRPLLVRMPDSHFNLANFMRANLYMSKACRLNGRL